MHSLIKSFYLQFLGEGRFWFNYIIAYVRHLNKLQTNENWQRQTRSELLYSDDSKTRIFESHCTSCSVDSNVELLIQVHFSIKSSINEPQTRIKVFEANAIF